MDENGSYTFVVGDGADDKRSALGAINLRACQGIAAACRHEAIIACKVNEVKVQVAAAPGDEASFLAGLGSLTAGVAGADAAAAVDVSEAGLAALRASYPARDDLGGGIGARPAGGLGTSYCKISATGSSPPFPASSDSSATTNSK